MTYTRLPLWRLYEPAKEEAYRRAVGYWPFVGWLTGGIMALVLWLGLEGLSLGVAVVLVILSRILVTGAFHEDGLADFTDGMGGGRGREDSLRIMKDSHIGTYGVLALIVYILTLYLCLRELTMAFGLRSLQSSSPCHNPILMTAAAILTCDVWGKCLASLLPVALPYARREEEAKLRLAYLRPKWGWQAVRIVVALLPIALLWWQIGIVPPIAVICTPVVVVALLSLWLRRRLGGYTGDCCGASFLLSELSMYLVWNICVS
ncbi:MAG: adenosylcobinamide-GDP ribazoletransferase [Prevotellaceae bacterium]|nr:adenosylcobinamide-GDP ribazoletransferase [Prevotellaceae bacterium]